MVDNVPISRRSESSTAAFQEQFSSPNHIAAEFHQKNPLENALIIDHVFSFLTIDTIKQCRLVCKKWNDISIRYMENKTTVVLKSLARIAEIEESYSESLNTFPDTPTLTFRAFQIPRNDCQRFLSTVTRFLEGQKLHIRELKFERIGSVIIGEIPNCYSINSIIGNNLNNLAIICSDLAVSVDKLTSTKFLNFENCLIDVSSNSTLAPKSFRMNDVTVVRDNAVVRNLVVNEILSFEHLKHLDLLSVSRTSLSINLAGNVTIETLKLQYIEMAGLLNFEKSNWKITGKVLLIGIPFEKHTQMEFVELDFKDSHLNLNVLPKSIKRLSLQFGLYNVTKIVASPMPKSRRCHQLPNLEYLFVEALTGREDCQMFRPLAQFTYCQNLTTIILKTNSQYSTENHPGTQILNTKWIPKSVKALTISGRIEVEGSPINLDKVVVQNFCLHYFLANLHKLKSNHLILDFSFPRNQLFGIGETIVTVIRMPYNSVTIGSYETDCWSFSNYVDKEACNYVFENEKGKAIQAEEFSKILRTAMNGIRSE